MNSHANTTPDSLVTDYWDYRLERDKFWDRLRRYRYDVIRTDPELIDVEKFQKVLLDNYGVKIHLNESGQILPSYDVVDESSFTMFLLKYDR